MNVAIKSDSDYVVTSPASEGTASGQRIDVPLVPPVTISGGNVRLLAR